VFTSVLIANRGEIAVRICKTLREMGIRSVVVASIPDRHSLAVRSADAWVLLEGYSATETYLDIDAVIAAAKAESCEAIHPGYGFLSERADFAERCAAEGIVFVGPPPAVLRGMGDKSAARRLAFENGVPVIPGWDGEDDAETLGREAERIGYPVMLKARGGGGGRGMREVFAAAELPEAIESARREAQSAFGASGLLIEKLVTNAHHVEVQVLADQNGNVIHLGERDCSVQRRHQKLIEETPSPVVDEALRAELTGAALQLARAIDYVNAGTFEFLVGEPVGDGKRPFYFLEVNPRLQVEHPVTEMVTGLDLVELQLRIAAGEPLPLRQEDVKFEGHAIEFRINAEDPWDGFKPSSGRIARLVESIRGDDSQRDDMGYDEGDSVPPQYDSLLWKVVVHGRDRGEAMDRSRILRHNVVDGVRTNLDLLNVILTNSDFRGTTGVGTEWLEANFGAFSPDPGPPEEWWAAAGLGIWQLPALDGRDKRPRFEASPRWRGAGESTLWLSDGRRIREVASASAGLLSGPVRVDESVLAFQMRATVRGFDVTFPVSGLVAPTEWLIYAGRLVRVGTDDVNQTFQVVQAPALPRRAHAAGGGATAITAPLAGTIVAVRVAEGDAVEAGQVVALLEAMKMEHRITAPSAGTVRSVAVRERDVVREGDVVAEVE
jgi:acetyl/propionyl-CoA carboxylase alpha subunit